MTDFSKPDECFWKPIYFNLTELMNLGTNLYDYNGEENGVKWHVYYANGWNVEVEKDGIIYICQFTGNSMNEPRKFSAVQSWN